MAGFIRFDSQVSKEKRDFYEMKNRASEFYHQTNVPQQIECVLNEMFVDKPDDLYGYLANFFMKLSAPQRISRLGGKETYDARGQVSIQAEVFCVVRNEQKLTSSAAVSNDRGLAEESTMGPKAEGKERVHHVATALQWINGPLDELLKGLDPCNQTDIDHLLSEFFSARYQEEKEFRSVEMDEKNSSCEPETVAPPQPPPQPLPVPSKEKKGDKGKKGAIVEKPVPPYVPPEPEVPGSLAIGSVSLAVAKAGALIQDVPLYKYISTLRKQDQNGLCVPLPLVTLLTCGKTSPGKLNLLEEVIFVPRAGQQVRQVTGTALQLQNEMIRVTKAAAKAWPTQATLCAAGALVVGCERPEQALELIAEASNNLGLEPGADFHLAVNCAAHGLMDYAKGKYEVMAGSSKSPDELVDMYQTLVLKNPAVVALIDPLRKEDVEQWARLSSVIGASCSLFCGESQPTYRPQCLQAQAPPPLPGVKGHIVQHVNAMTVSDLVNIATDNPDAVILSTACSELCCDDSLSDMAVGLGVSYIKLGGPRGGERLAKYNRLIAIEEELSQQGILVSRNKHSLPLFVEKPENQDETVRED